MTGLEGVSLSRELVFERAYGQEQGFLAYLLRHIKRVYRKFTGKK